MKSSGRHLGLLHDTYAGVMTTLRCQINGGGGGGGKINEGGGWEIFENFNKRGVKINGGGVGIFRKIK